MTLLATIHNTAGALTLIGWLIVIGCLCGAAYCAYIRNGFGLIGLVVVAIIAAALLL